VRNGAALRAAFSLTPPEQDEHEPWLSEYTLQRTRRFRALDVWAIIQSAGRNGLAEAIANNNKMALLFAHLVETQDDLELISSGPLSIVRFRFAPPQLRNKPLLLDQLNKAVAYEMQQRGRAFLTSTRFQGKEALRACIVNYMTTEADIQAIVDETLYAGRKVVSRYS
jgi:glutamate/tyrosine decarboxylase-like PLP-dependent enzyme